MHAQPALHSINLIKQKNIEKLILIETLCNDASAETDNEKKKATGDPIEIAILDLTAASEANPEALKK